MKHLISSLIILISLNLKAQITFEKQHHFSNYEHTDGNFVVQTYDSGYFVAGELDLLGDTGRILLLRANKNGDILWDKTFGHFSESHFNSAALTSDSGMIIVGGNSYPQGPNYYNELYLIRTNKDGDTIWTKADSTISSFGNLIQQTFDGGYIMTASNNAGGNEDIMLVRMDASGSILWTQTFPSSHVEDAEFLIQTLDSGFALAGYQYNATGDSTEGMLLRTSSNGTIIWKKYYSSSSDVKARGLVQTLDGALVVAIDETDDSLNNDDIILMKTDSANGNTIWTKRFGSSLEDENTHHLALCDDGGFLITGTIEDTVNEYLFILRANSSGDTTWVKRILYAEADWGQQTNDNGFIFTGYDNGNSPINFLYLLKIDSAGNFSTAINEPKLQVPFVLFPNPATSTFTIRGERNLRNANVEIYNLLGDRIYSSTYSEQLTVNCEHFAKGIYFVKFQIEGITTFQKQIIY